MAQPDDGNWIGYGGGSPAIATYRPTLYITSAILSCVVWLAACSGSNAEAPRTVKGSTHRVNLDGPGDVGAVPCEVVQMLDSKGEPSEYFMDVDSVVCADATCEIVTVRIHFDPLGNYESYELPQGGNLTKSGHKPFSRADHQNLHRILSDPYSQLKSIAWDQITMPKGAMARRDGVDGISGATILSKRSIVVVGAAYTCCTLWHWSHGQVVDEIRDMTIRASDKQDLIRYLQKDDEFAVFAMDQLRTQELFDAEIIAAVTQAMRHGSHGLTRPALNYLQAASKETGVDHFFCCGQDEHFLTDSIRRVRFLEALRDAEQKPPSGYLQRFGDWLRRADSYYEVHLLLSLLERDDVYTDQVVNAVFSLLESEDSLVVRRSHQYLESEELSDSQQAKFDAIKQQHPD